MESTGAKWRIRCGRLEDGEENKICCTPLLYNKCGMNVSPCSKGMKSLPPRIFSIKCCPHTFLASFQHLHRLFSPSSTLSILSYFNGGSEAGKGEDGRYSYLVWHPYEMRPLKLHPRGFDDNNTNNINSVTLRMFNPKCIFLDATFCILRCSPHHLHPTTNLNGALTSPSSQMSAAKGADLSLCLLILVSN